MAFCKFSSESIISSSTQVDNIFIHDYLPTAPNSCVKIYLFGLYKCANPNAFNNTITDFAEELGVSEQDIEDAFLYWQDQGLVNVILGTQFQVRYLPLNNIINNTKKFKKDKYSDFNKQAQEIIEGRMITSTEYTEYYSLMEIYNIEPIAFIMIMQYCTEIKGKNVGYAYILTVARNWASENITTSSAVEEKIKELNNYSSEITSVLKICNIRRQPTVEEQELFIKWTKTFKFTLNAIKFVANMQNNKFGKTNFSKLDTALTKYYEIDKMSDKEIREYEDSKLEMFDLAKKTCKTIGVYYENLENIIDTYISKWLELGHNENSILALANYCFKNNLRTLTSLDETILKFYKLGIVSTEAITEYLEQILLETKEIKEILEKLGLSRNVTSKDREFVNTWKYVWNTSEEVLNFAIEKAVDKANQMQYVNKLLATWHTQGIKTIEMAKNFTFENYENKKQPKTTQPKSWEREYKKEDLENLFKSLEEIDID